MASAVPRGLRPPHTVACGALAGLRTRGHDHRSPTGRRFPGPAGPVLDDGGRSLSPLRGSPGFAPGSLLPRPSLRDGRTSCSRHHIWVRDQNNNTRWSVGLSTCPFETTAAAPRGVSCRRLLVVRSYRLTCTGVRAATRRSGHRGGSARRDPRSGRRAATPVGRPGPARGRTRGWPRPARSAAESGPGDGQPHPARPAGDLGARTGRRAIVPGHRGARAPHAAVRPRPCAPPVGHSGRGPRRSSTRPRRPPARRSAGHPLRGAGRRSEVA